MRPPWTPLPRRLGAYSARSTDRNHSITLWLDHCTTSEGERLVCEGKRRGKKSGLIGPPTVLCGVWPRCLTNRWPSPLSDQAARPVAWEPSQFPRNRALMESCRIFYTEISDFRILLLPNFLVNFGTYSPKRHIVIHSVIQQNFKEDYPLWTECFIDKKISL